MTPTRLPGVRTLGELPPEWAHDPLPDIRLALRQTGQKVVVVADDPACTLASCSVPFLTAWSVDSLRDQMLDETQVFLIITNSRDMDPRAAYETNLQVGRNLRQAAEKARRDYVVVSCGDAALRGYFPGEVEALAGGAGIEYNATLLVPFSVEAGCYTFGDVHYVADADWLVPAGETDFARDPRFGYTASDLKEWVAEKTGGYIPASAVESVSIDDIRQGGPERVATRLSHLPHGATCIVNACSDRDLEVFARGLTLAEELGKRFICRASPSFVPVRAGLEPCPLLRAPDLGLRGMTGGLIVVGSFSQRTRTQVGALVEVPGVVARTLRLDDLLSGEFGASAIRRAASEIGEQIGRGDDVLLAVEHPETPGGMGDVTPAGPAIDALVEVVNALAVQPHYILAKGSSTAFQIAVRALGLKKGIALGQVLPGTAVWRLGSSSRFPGLIYIVAPGSAGGPYALADIVTALSSKVRS